MRKRLWGEGKKSMNQAPDTRYAAQSASSRAPLRALSVGADYAAVAGAFRWSIPQRFNMGVAALDAHRASAGPALIDLAADGTLRPWSAAELLAMACRLSNVLTAHGIGRGDRLAILLPQAPETAIAHCAAYRSGMIALPLFGLFGAEALDYRLSDSGTAAIVTDLAGLEKLLPLRGRLPALKLILVIGLGRDLDPGCRDFAAACAKAADWCDPVNTAADDPAVIIYTSGTTGQPKGALHAHRVLLGHLPGVELPHHFFPQPGDLFWTPADWAWIGGLFDVLMPSLYHGVPVLAHRMAKFDPDRAFDLIRRHGVRNLFLPPTALKLMRQAGTPTARDVRSVASGGESLGAELRDWGRQVFGTTINEFYGQTECNLIVGSDNRLFPVRPGSMGRAIPGHQVAVIDGDGQPVAPGALGMIAVRRPDPVMFLGYWNKPEATAQKFLGDWLLTGDQGRMDADGYLYFVGRDDDVITSAGYRIGPGEIEDCLLKHPAVAMAAAVGKPDPIRTEIVKAFIVLKPGTVTDDALRHDLQTFVKQRLAAHEYPREIAFVDSLPMTATGKIIRRALRQDA